MLEVRTVVTPSGVWEGATGRLQVARNAVS